MIIFKLCFMNLDFGRFIYRDEKRVWFGIVKKEYDFGYWEFYVWDGYVWVWCFINRVIGKRFRVLGDIYFCFSFLFIIFVF